MLVFVFIIEVYTSMFLSCSIAKAPALVLFTNLYAFICIIRDYVLY